MPRESGHGSGWEAAFIDEQRVARLATISPEDRPHLVPVCFVQVGEALFVPVDEKPKRNGELARVRNIRAHPRCGLLFDRYSDDWKQLAWVRLDCTASIIERGEEAPDALSALRARYEQYAVMDLESRPVLRFEVERVASWRWAE